MRSKKPAILAFAMMVLTLLGASSPLDASWPCSEFNDPARRVCEEADPVVQLVIHPPITPADVREALVPDCGVLGLRANAVCAHGSDARHPSHGVVQCDGYFDPSGAAFHTGDPCVHSALNPDAQECHAAVSHNPGGFIPVVLDAEPRHAGHCNHGTDTRFPAHADVYCPNYHEAPGATSHSLKDPCVHLLSSHECGLQFVQLDVDCKHGEDDRSIGHGPDAVKCDVFQDPGMTSVERNDNLHGVPSDVSTADECMHYEATAVCSILLVQVNCRHQGHSMTPGHTDVYCPVYVHSRGATEHQGNNFCVHLAPHACVDPVDTMCMHGVDPRPASHSGGLPCEAFVDDGGSGSVHLGPTGCLHGPNIAAGVQYIACTLTGTQDQTTNCAYPCEELFQWSIRVLTVGPPTSSVTGRLRCTGSGNWIVSCTASVQVAMATCMNGPVTSSVTGTVVCDADVDGSKPQPYHYVVVCSEPRDPKDLDGHEPEDP